MSVENENTIELLQRYESRNITYVDPEGDWPIVWEKARGCHVWDSQGKKYLDLTAAFGVAAAGHANSKVVRAGQDQMATLCHAMGDVHPHAGKANLARELSRLTYERWTKSSCGKTIFCNSGFEAVEAALKTALLKTGKSGIIAFEGAYHGLGYGALGATHRGMFRDPFKSQLKQFGSWAPFPDTSRAFSKLRQEVARLFEGRKIGAVLIEPIQGRGGIRVPVLKSLRWLADECARHGALLIFDEIYTGFGRTGRWFAGEHWQVTPDLVCLGKALTGGFPMSACVGDATVMDQAWPEADGEAIHTSTFLGHPVGCAMALENLSEITRLKLTERADETGRFLLRELSNIPAPKGYRLTARGLGLMVGLEILRGRRPATDESVTIMKRMLKRGFVILPEGDAGNIIGFIPPLTITRLQLTSAVKALAAEIAEMGGKQ
ncbi:MAG: aspartate aminotransferase family protein [Verrucomicrobiia bacterium]